ncbi:extracellular solute-binding protein [Cohnella rhizosphaerae]|uniref:Extracellular solute-binding protein n=1 Tax=Cohnella rhizosphaerae TaxID=1457232 RepID=A0A9X4KVX4_9BACL|nr:extracellular solute-binding protein [Cohnella rhizosphaerae]MDG0811291.1 extracellular solute-binding protein [Cohnella rhizosphaerae]
MKLFKKMEEITNIHVEWITPPTDSFEEKKNLAFASNDLPDAFFLWINRDTETTRGADGSFIPLEGLIDKYAVNYKKAMEQFPTLKGNTTNLDGHVYATGIVQDVPRDLTFKQWINQSWLDKLGLAMPKTTDDLYDVLKAFKTKDPNGNGKADEIPLSAVNLGQTRNFILSAFGYVSNGIELNKEDKAVFVPTEPQYKDYLAYMNKLYKEDLLDRETFTLKPEQLSAKGQAGILGSFDHAAAFLGVGADRDKDYAAVPPLTSPDNADPVWLKFSDVWTGGLRDHEKQPVPGGDDPLARLPVLRRRQGASELRRRRRGLEVDRRYEDEMDLYAAGRHGRRGIPGRQGDAGSGHGRDRLVEQGLRAQAGRSADRAHRRADGGGRISEGVEGAVPERLPDRGRAEASERHEKRHQHLRLPDGSQIHHRGGVAGQLAEVRRYPRQDGAAGARPDQPDGVRALEKHEVTKKRPFRKPKAFGAASLCAYQNV